MGIESSTEKELLIRLASGKAQSLQLFDHSSTQIKQITKQLVFPCYIREIGDGSLELQSKESQNSIFQINRVLGKNVSINSLKGEKELWKIIHEKQPIQVGQIIKMGKMKLILKEIAFSFGKSVNIPHIESSVLSQTLLEHEPYSLSHKEKQCRICFDCQEPANPLISLCRCSGTVKYTHFNCLKDWIASDFTTKIYPNYMFYSYIMPKCELCKTLIDIDFEYEGKKYSLYPIEKFLPPYALLENQQLENEKLRKNIYIIKLSEGKEINIGRNNVSEVVIKDISVSRTHCSFIMEGNTLFIQDKQSKFGTLIKLREQNINQINGQLSLALQYQNKIIKIEQLTQNSGFCCTNTDNITQIKYQAFKNKKILVDEDDKRQSKRMTMVHQ